MIDSGACYALQASFAGHGKQNHRETPGMFVSFLQPDTNDAICNADYPFVALVILHRHGIGEAKPSRYQLPCPLVAAEDCVDGPGKIGVADAGVERGRHQIADVQCWIEVGVAERVAEFVHYRRQQVDRF